MDPDQGLFATILTRRKLLAYGLSSAGLIALEACTKTPSSKRASTPSVAPRPGGTLTAAFGYEPASLDPQLDAGIAVSTISGLITETVLNIDSQYKIYPGLAESWTVAPDGKSVDLTLKGGIQFTDGAPWNAQALKINLDRIADPDTASPAARDYISFSTYDGTEAVDELHARVHWKEPWGLALIGLANGFVGMVSPKAIMDAGKNTSEHPIGTGPYEFVEWVKQSHVTVKKRQDYAGGGPPLKHTGPGYLDEIRVMFASDDATRTGLLESGQADLIWRVPAQDAGRLTDGGFTTLSKPNLGMPLSFFLNTTKPPTNDIALRQAMLYATDRNAYVQTAYFGLASPEFGPITHVSLGYDPSVESMYPFSVDKAKQVLDTAGWVLGPDGVRVKGGVRAELEHYVSDVDAKIAPIFQSQQKAIGITINQKNTEYSVALGAVLSGKAQVASDDYAGALDPAIAYGCYWSTPNLMGCDLSSFATPELDSLLTQAAGSTEVSQRTELYSQAQRIVMDNAPFVPILAVPDIWGIDKKVHGFDLWITPRRGLLYDVFMTGS